MAVQLDDHVFDRAWLRAMACQQAAVHLQLEHRCTIIFCAHIGPVHDQAVIGLLHWPEADLGPHPERIDTGP